ncbi:Thiamine-repressible mitochondrial transport protein THI74 [Cyberlindnera fabianii]|nr:Thiamine-repressible mitochondrial transport protein THI74 [Cyberlindnera fabianii]
MLGVVVLSWVLSSFLVNDLFEKDLYRKPFFLTYINTATFMFYLTPYVRKLWTHYRESGKLEYKEVEEEFLSNSSDEEILLNEEQNQKLSLMETIKLSAQFCVIWYLANLATNASLSYTSVGSQTILSSTSSFFTLVVGALAKTEKFNHVKVVGLVLSFVGVILITKADGDQVSEDLQRTKLSIFIGNTLALLGALLYGVYTTLLKYKIRDEARVNMKVFFGFVGVFNLILLWPSLIVFDYLGVEKFELPSGSFVIMVIIVNCLITFVSDFCWVKAMLLTSPLTVTVGLSTTIPFAMVGDIIFKGEKITLVYIVAAAMICVSFFVINRDEENDRHVE